MNGARSTERSLRAHFDRVVRSEFTVQPLGPMLAPLSLAELEVLPACVRRYVQRSGAVGRPRPQNMRVAMDARMYRKPGQSPMQAHVIQYTFFGAPARLFLMDAKMFGLPVRALHIYRDATATFTVRIASAVSLVNLSGNQISATETVTVLNDLCVMAPGALLDPRLSWSNAGDRSATVAFTNGPHRVEATMEFNDRDELVDFWSDDRPDSSSGAFIPRRWSTPITGYQDVDGRHVMRDGAALYHLPEGPFTYGEFTLRSVTYDVAGPPQGGDVR